jgi:hypothetical protein
MIVRTADRLFVTEAQLDEAIGIVEAVCATAGVHPEIEITTATDPETDDPPVTMFVGHFTETMPIDAFVDLIFAMGQPLHDAGLDGPDVRLSFQFVPEW